MHAINEEKLIEDLKSIYSMNTRQWWCTSLIPVLRSQRQVNLNSSQPDLQSEFQNRLGYTVNIRSISEIVRPCLEIKVEKWSREYTLLVLYWPTTCEAPGSILNIKERERENKMTP